VTAIEEDGPNGSVSESAVSIMPRSMVRVARFVKSKEAQDLQIWAKWP